MKQITIINCYNAIGLLPLPHCLFSCVPLFRREGVDAYSFPPPRCPCLSDNKLQQSCCWCTGDPGLPVAVMEEPVSMKENKYQWDLRTRFQVVGVKWKTHIRLATGDLCARLSYFAELPIHSCSCSSCVQDCFSLDVYFLTKGTGRSVWMTGMSLLNDSNTVKTSLTPCVNVTTRLRVPWFTVSSKGCPLYNLSYLILMSFIITSNDMFPKQEDIADVSEEKHVEKNTFCTSTHRWSIWAMKLINKWMLTCAK